MQRLLPILLCLICTGFSQQAAAWGALGCDYGINVPAFVSCVTTSAKTQADTAVTNATTGLNATIEDLQNSPLLAAAGIEQTMLNILRKNEIQN